MNTVIDSVLVNCPICTKEFNIDKSEITEYSGILAITYDKLTCPHCNKSSARFRDIKKKQELDEANANPKPPQPKPVICPKCHSNQLCASEKGFSFAKALGGGALLGNVGLLAGLHGSKRLYLTCLACGHKWKVGN